MGFTPASPLSLTAFVLVMAGVLAAILLAMRRAGIPVWLACVGALLLLGIDAALVQSGWTQAAPGHLTLFLVGNNLSALVLALSPLGGKIARTSPLAALVGFQALRLPLELVLHSWANAGVIPETMTWSGIGQNFDIVSGALALLVALALPRSRAAAWMVNAIGFALLINVIRVALLSSPLPFSWHLAQPLLLVAHLPYALIVPLGISSALAGHLLLTRALLLPRISSAS